MKVDEVLQKTKGIEAWVTIGGFSVIDNANLSNAFTTFVVYDDWNKRGPALNQDNILNGLRRSLASAIEEALTLVVAPPPIRGLGQSGGFQLLIEDRGNLGMEELQKTAMEI